MIVDDARSLRKFYELLCISENNQPNNRLGRINHKTESINLCAI